ncbi:hypothetical protein [Dankookia sp. P2]|uniref:hypothetical protein n=1 Tax=Dankookia sp. P2 TaxID=3423955 RepID=UPI003D666E9D
MSDKTAPKPTRSGEPPDDPGRIAPDQRQGLERASGTIDRPIGTDDAQPGDRAERAAQLGGPIDIFPTRRDRSGLEEPLGTEDPTPDPKT